MIFICSPLLLLLACEGASSDPGLRALLRIEGAQFEPGKMPKPDKGPEVRSVHLPHNELLVGTQRERMTGTLAPEANAVAIAREGDAGYWIVTAGLPRVEEPDLPTFSVILELSRETPAKPFAIILSALDSGGRFGPRQRLQLSATDASVQGELVVMLRWDTDADLDLHLTDPSGTEIWARNINSYNPPSPGQPPADANAWQAGGILDFDSNAQCVIDGRCEENVYWEDAPPSGHYRVKVATASLCGQTYAHWTVEAQLRGKTIASASGISVASDTREPSGSGSGVLALEFSVP
jgi:hypothetical protein